MDQAAAKQQIVERIKQASNILVTVSNNPSVDQLAACIGLTLLINKMGKHGTAIFSGMVPSTLEFLQPDKTIEKNTDSLQDFIISLDKNKADKLRYKVEDQVVRIFITPYRTSISEKDVVFSHGDFNVDAVLALGIKERSQIDQAIAAHGRILHDATVISINNGAGKPVQLGQLNWQDPTASSLCEMLVSISEAFGTGLLDNQMATAFLTGLVAETNRFSNKNTSPKVMTMAAQLMAAGANQQLIVSKLEPPAPAPPPPAPPKPPTPPAPKAVPGPPAPPPAPKMPPPKKDGSLSISHDNQKPDSGEVEISSGEIRIDKQGNLIGPDQGKEPAPPAGVAVPPASPPTPPPAPLPPLPQPPTELTLPTPPPTPEITSVHLDTSNSDLNLPPIKAQTPPPPIEHGHSLMSADSHPPSMSAPFSADMQTEWMDPYNSVSMDPLTAGSSSSAMYEHSQAAETTGGGEVDDARNAVQSALAASPFDPAVAGPVAALNAQPLIPDTPAPAPPTNDTPSLSLPANGNGEIGTVTPYVPPSDQPAPAAPPPVPPPLPLSSNPGAMLPNNQTFQPPTT